MNKGIYDVIREHLKDFHIVDCVIRSRNCIYIMFQNEYAEGEKIRFRAGFCYPKTERVWGFDGYYGFDESKSCVIPNGPVIVVDFCGQVISQTGETERASDFDTEVGIPIIDQVSVMRVVEIDGRAHMAGTLRTVFRRESSGVWTCLFGNDLALRDVEDRQDRAFGFNDIGGFAADDIYACGGKGDLCHYDGKRWDVIDCPTNQNLSALCCAGNGKVYVGGRKGILLEGRGDAWKVVRSNGPMIVRTEWFGDRLYLATEQGLYEYHDGSVGSAPGLSGLISDIGTPEPVLNKRLKNLLRKGGAGDEAIELVSMSGFSKEEGILTPGALHSLSTDGELLLVGGADTVVVFDGVDWRTLYARYGAKGGSLDL
ncbi:MAG: hypothetical protein GY765_35325 [bacterium]|nr:hypothetical protein [bacterium]